MEACGSGEHENESGLRPYIRLPFDATSAHRAYMGIRDNKGLRRALRPDSSPLLANRRSPLRPRPTRRAAAVCELANVMLQICPTAALGCGPDRGFGTRPRPDPGSIDSGRCQSHQVSTLRTSRSIVGERNGIGRVHPSRRGKVCKPDRHRARASGRQRCTRAAIRTGQWTAIEKCQ
jgi:hypothetical protein